MADMTTLEVDNCNNSVEYTDTGKDDIQKYIAPVVKVVLEEIVDSVVSQLSNQMSICMSSERFHPSVDTLELDNCNISFEYTGQKSAMIPKYIISVRFHSSVRKVESGTFENCYLLREVEFNNGLCSIRKHAFFECNSLESITLPRSLSSIGNSAFAGCNNLEDVKLNAGLKHIEKMVFEECTALTSVNFPSTITYIGDSAFAGCRQLREVKFNESSATLEVTNLQPPQDVIRGSVIRGSDSDTDDERFTQLIAENKHIPERRGPGAYIQFLINGRDRVQVEREEKLCWMPYWNHKANLNLFGYHPLLFASERQLIVLL